MGTEIIKNRWQLNQLPPPILLKMKQSLIAIAALVLVGCGESQQSAPTEEAKPVDPVGEVPAQPPSPAESQPAETVTEAVNPEPPTGKAPDISIHDAAGDGNIESVKQFLATGTDVNAKAGDGTTPLHHAAGGGHKEIVQLLIAKGADVNAIVDRLKTPLDNAIKFSRNETADFIRKKGGKTGQEMGYK